VCEILGRSGVRVSELCALKIGQLRLHDPDGAHFNIPDAKTRTGIREVQMTPDLVEAVIEHIDLLRRCGRPTGPESFLAQSTNGGRMSRQRAGEIVRDAAVQASHELAGKGLAPLPRATPHSLRRTYISIALLANNFDVKWVMSQVGHADSKMTLDVYAQLEQRVDRSHGASFDGLVRKARDRFAALPQQPTPTIATSLPRNGHDGEKPTTTVTKRPAANSRRPPVCSANVRWDSAQYPPGAKLGPSSRGLVRVAGSRLDTGAESDVDAALRRRREWTRNRRGQCSISIWSQNWPVIAGVGTRRRVAIGRGGGIGRACVAASPPGMDAKSPNSTLPDRLERSVSRRTTKGRAAQHFPLHEEVQRFAVRGAPTAVPCDDRAHRRRRLLL
jgi:hypothetical protein